MAFKCYTQISIDGSTVTNDIGEDWLEVFEIDFEIYLPYDVEQNRPTGSRRIAPFRMVLEQGKPTIFLVQALCEGKKADVEISWRKIPDDGFKETEYFNTKLTQAVVVRSREWSPLTKKPELENLPDLVEISLVAQTYDWESAGALYNEPQVAVT